MQNVITYNIKYWNCNFLLFYILVVNQYNCAIKTHWKVKKLMTQMLIWKCCVLLIWTRNHSFICLHLLWKCILYPLHVWYVHTADAQYKYTAISLDSYVNLQNLLHSSFLWVFFLQSFICKGVRIPLAPFFYFKMATYLSTIDQHLYCL